MPFTFLSLHASISMPSEIHLSGILAGRLWWPVGTAVTRESSASVIRDTSGLDAAKTRTVPTATPYPDLRSALVEMLCDPDLSSTGFLPGSLEIRVQKRTIAADGSTRSRTRRWRVRGRCWATDDVFADALLVADCE